MTKTRSYKLLCPIARGLDRIGDRWTLLILRDLHAGPARFTDLQHGLKGIAANLLTDRLKKLSEDQLVENVDRPNGAGQYRLTELGQSTLNILFELAKFGAGFPPAGDVVRPGNLRTVATTLGAAAQRVDDNTFQFDASIVVDGEHMWLSVQNGQKSMCYERCSDPDVVFETTYDALLAITEREMSLETFLSEHTHLVVCTQGKDTEFMQFMTQVFVVLS